MPGLSLIISVYNKPELLNLIFTALKNQTFRDFEVVIADDGSGDEIRQLIEKWNNFKLFPIKHIRQDDVGFRKNKILNKAIVNCSSDYIVFIDGDCIPHHKFLESHFNNKESNSVLCGRRVYLGKEISESLTPEIIENLNIEKINFKNIIESFSRKEGLTYSIEEGFYIKNKFIRNLIIKNDTTILGSNFSLYKNLLMKVNGFDENYTGPGIGEDMDIEWRLRKIGAKMKSVKNLAIQYHIYHPKTKEDEKNYNYFHSSKDTLNLFCKNGIIKNEN